ncbi:MAG: hypothetical protein ACK5MN_04290 [Lachnospiraceae bacterium]
MSTYILSTSPQAETPYYIKNISQNIYSIEELCFYIFHNLYLMDETIMNEDLCLWIETELKMEALARTLTKVISLPFTIKKFVYPIFATTGYYSYEELKEFAGQVKRFEEETDLMRRKMRADTLMENKLYVNAIKVYKGIVKRLDLQKDSPFFAGEVYHNIGCAFSRLFHTEDALHYFAKANDALHTQKSLMTYLYAYYLARTPIEYQSKLEEMGVDAATRDELQKSISEAIQDISEPEAPSEMEETLKRLTNEYQKSTGVSQ